MNERKAGNLWNKHKSFCIIDVLAVFFVADVISVLKVICAVVHFAMRLLRALVFAVLVMMMLSVVKNACCDPNCMSKSC